VLKPISLKLSMAARGQHVKVERSTIQNTSNWYIVLTKTVSFQQQRGKPTLPAYHNIDRCIKKGFPKIHKTLGTTSQGGHMIKASL